ncbi:TrkA C-terminal domain-containing protein [Thalassoglobus sp. JC818]|uniref:aspartate:alanine exchanger family transporter n=1 Tax=Thalassoglobus sp. JC818 TaxID=3232136 RepID=UPI003458054C
MDESTQQLLSLLVVVGLGLLFGKVSLRGISLGTSGVVFVALVAGHFGFRVPETAGQIGVVLFVYCLGIGAGSSFFQVLFSQGKSLSLMAGAMILSGGLTTWFLAQVFSLKADLAGGLFAGALTSTPALAAAIDSLPPGSKAAVGFGIAYPFGVICVIVFIQLIAKQFINSEELQKSDDTQASGDGAISNVLVEISNPAVIGKRPSQVTSLSNSKCQISRVLVDGRLQPLKGDFVFEAGQKVLIVGGANRLGGIVEVLGQSTESGDYIRDTDRQRRRVVVTSSEVVGKTLEQLHLRSRMGITVTRVFRQEIEFVPSPKDEIYFGDALTVIGEPEAISEFVRFAGHRERTLDETDLISLVAGLSLGILLGQVRFGFGDLSITLGMAGGPLIVGLILGRVRKIGPLAVRIPPAAKLLLGEVGLALFLAQAGASAGQKFVSVIAQYGLVLCLVSICVVTVPLIVGVVMARRLFKIGWLEALGGICGAMTSTPGLGAITSTVDSSRPATSYATAYPLALILITLLTPALIAFIG